MVFYYYLFRTVLDGLLSMLPSVVFFYKRDVFVTDGTETKLVIWIHLRAQVILSQDSPRDKSGYIAFAQVAEVFFLSQSGARLKPTDCSRAFHRLHIFSKSPLAGYTYDVQLVTGLVKIQLHWKQQQTNQEY